MTDTLFDPDLYGPGTKPRKRPERPSFPVEQHEEPWVLMRNRQGVAPFFHLPATRNSAGATVALCGLQGTTITNVGVNQMIRCPVCMTALDVRS
ncbi:MAG TPA: hypothetical protein VFX15_00330 [Actinomycetes bacterium]|nr:hypothetical protein [Actinomycetes bacterium]